MNKMPAAALLCWALLGGGLFAQQKSVTLVRYDELAAILVDMPGYEASGTFGNHEKGERVDGYAGRYYKKLGVAFAVEITDARTDFKQIIESFEEGSAAEKQGRRIRKVIFDGWSAVEAFERETKSMIVVLKVADRFIVSIEGIPLESSEGLKDLFSRLDLRKLAELGK